MHVYNFNKSVFNNYIYGWIKKKKEKELLLYVHDLQSRFTAVNIYKRDNTEDFSLPTVDYI